MTAPDWNKQSPIYNKTVLDLFCRIPIMVLRLGDTRKARTPTSLPHPFFGDD